MPFRSLALGLMLAGALVTGTLVPNLQPSALADLPATVLRVSDGDTLKVRIAGREERIRLLGIDSPEAEENDKAARDSERSGEDLETILAAGRRSRDFLRKLLPPGESVTIEQDVEARDRYGRMLGYVWLDSGKMLNELMVREGFAGLMTHPPNVRYADRLKAAFVDARNERRGLWEHSPRVVPLSEPRRKR